MLFPLKCPAQNYAWGKPGSESTVASLLLADNEKIDVSKPYAEFWIGTHVNGPAKLRAENLTLESLLKTNPHFQSCNELSIDETGNLPYLFKILSVNKALSIQAHPDIPLAQKLHAEFPSIYKDPNHKPEMACAITEFEALAGFQSIESIMQNIQMTPELGELLEESTSQLSETKLESSEELKILFTALMKSDEEIVKENVSRLQRRLEGLGNDITMPNKLALRLCHEYPGDVGVFCVYFMCYRCLQPGEAVFLGANEPHAYLKGDCAEVMARSDNVVRAGLTPKLRDVNTLCEMLTYSEPSSVGFFPPGNILKPIVRDENTHVYAPPDPNVDEFELERIVMKPNSVYEPKLSTYGAVILVLEGRANATYKADSGLDDTIQITRGNTFFQAAGSTLKLETQDVELIIFRTTTKGAIM